MSYYVAPFTFDFAASLIRVDAGVSDVICLDLYTAIKEAQSSQEGILYRLLACSDGGRQRCSRERDCDP